MFSQKYLKKYESPEMGQNGTRKAKNGYWRQQDIPFIE